MGDKGSGLKKQEENKLVYISDPALIKMDSEWYVGGPFTSKQLVHEVTAQNRSKIW